MTTSGSTTFNLNLTEIVEEAFERVGPELRSGYDLRTARRSLNLLLIEWQNRGLNMWTIEDGEVELTSGTATYDLPIDTIDLLDFVIRTGSATTQVDANINRIGVSKYAKIPNKNTTGKPNQVYINRKSGATNFGGTIQYPTITVYPVPDSDDYTFVYWRMRRIQDAGKGIETQDLPFRFLPVITSGLAYQLALKTPELMPRIQMLKAEYEQQFDLAASEDREKAAVRFVPRQQFLGSGSL